MQKKKKENRKISKEEEQNCSDNCVDKYTG